MKWPQTDTGKDEQLNCLLTKRFSTQFIELCVQRGSGVGWKIFLILCRHQNKKFVSTITFMKWKQLNTNIIFLYWSVVTSNIWLVRHTDKHTQMQILQPICSLVFFSHLPYLFFHTLNNLVLVKMRSVWKQREKDHAHDLNLKELFVILNFFSLSSFLKCLLLDLATIYLLIH